MDRDLDPVDRIRESFGLEDIEDFWEKTKTNLQAKKIRLVFVADKIPQELRLIVEFLNRQMDPAEVLAVEIPQYVGASQTVVVPRVLGLVPKGRPPVEKKMWNAASFFSSQKSRDGILDGSNFQSDRLLGFPTYCATLGAGVASVYNPFDNLVLEHEYSNAPRDDGDNNGQGKPRAGE